MGRRSNGVPWILALGVVDFSLEQAILIPALPAIGTRYRASVTAVAWMVTGFLISSAVATPLAGRLGDRYGRRRVLLASLATFAVGSLMCALGPSIGVLIAGRVVQGLGAGVGPLAFALLPEVVCPERMPRAIGVLVGGGGIGAVVGFLAAGPLADHLSVSSIFWLLVAVAVGLGAGVVRSVPESAARSQARVDWSGAAILSALLGVFTLAISEGSDWGWRSPTIVALVAGSVLLLVTFAVRQHTAREPLLDAKSFTRPAVMGANVAVFMIGLALFGAYVLVPYIGGLPESTGYGLGLTTTQIGLLLAPGSVAAFIGGVAGGRLIRRFGARRQALGGMACTVVAYFMLTVLPRTAMFMSAALVALGFGIGAALVGIVELIMVSVSPEETGASVGLNSVLRATGAALGSQAAVAIVVAAPQLGVGVPSATGFTRAFVVGLVGSVAAVAIMALLPRDGPHGQVAGSGSR